jgi:hypothetical protein
MTPHAGPTPNPPDPGGVIWRKSSRSSQEQGCVEAAFLADGRVAVRDSKDREGPALVLPAVSGTPSSPAPRTASSTCPDGQSLICEPYWRS